MFHYHGIGASGPLSRALPPHTLLRSGPMGPDPPKFIYAKPQSYNTRPHQKATSVPLKIALEYNSRSTILPLKVYRLEVILPMV